MERPAVNTRPSGLTQRTSTQGTSSRRPGMERRTSTQGTRQTRGDMERRTTAPLGSIHSSQSRNDTNAPEQSQPPESVRERRSNLQRQQTQKKTDERFYVDNDYYSLNPWYEEGPPRPLFGFGRPFPRTVRRGMVRGRKEYGDHDQHAHADGQRDRQGIPTLRIPPRMDETGRRLPPPDRFEAETDGRRYLVTRIEDGDDTIWEHGIGPEAQWRDEHSESDEQPSKYDTHQGLQSPTMMPDRMEDGFHYDRPPPERKDTAKDSQSQYTVQTAQEQVEKEEINQREEEAVQDYYNTYRNPLARFRAKYPEALAEFLATTIYIFFGIAGTLYSVTYPAPKGDYATQSWAWGFAVTAGIYVGGGISGSHMNPWISISFSIFRGFPWKMCAVYVCVQIVAGFAAGTLAWFIYRDAIMHVDPDLTPSVTGIAFYTMPQEYVSTATAFFNNYLSMALYTCVAFAIGDDSNTPPGSGLAALIYGIMSFLLCICFGYNGLGVSPARDLGPRFIAWWVGYGTDTFKTGWWAYGPIAGGLAGAVTGALLYDVFIFVGGESPVNYQWPGPKQIGRRVRTGSWEAKKDDDEAQLAS